MEFTAKFDAGFNLDKNMAEKQLGLPKDATKADVQAVINKELTAYFNDALADYLGKRFGGTKGSQHL